MNLHNKGWGYTKIHRHLITNGFEIGKSRTTVDIMIKKMKKEMSFITNRLWMVMGILGLSGERFNYNISLRFFKNKVTLKVRI